MSSKMVGIKMVVAYLMLMMMNVASYNLAYELGKGRYKKSFILNINKKMKGDCPLLEYFNNRQKRVDDIGMRGDKEGENVENEKGIELWLDQVGEVSMLD